MAYLLVIDDEADLRFVLQTYLSGQGHTVDTAENGKAGLRLTERNSYDLVITDIVMPEMDGLEVITAIRQKMPHLSVIAMSGGSAKIDRSMLITTAHLMRADRVIAKPLNLPELKAIINEVLAG